MLSGSCNCRERSAGYHNCRLISPSPSLISPSSSLISPSQSLISPSPSLIVRQRQMGAEEKRTVSATAVDLKDLKVSVMSLLDKIQSGDDDEMKRAVSELRLLSKLDKKNRIVIGEAGSIPLMVSLLCSSDSEVQENVVTALLNLSIYPANRTAIMETEGVLESISEVLGAGATWEAKENVTALLSSLLILEDQREIIGKNSALLESLRDLFQNGRTQGKKDALRAIFHLALWPNNRVRLVKAGIISPLRVLLASPRPGLVEDTLSVLSQIAKCKDGTDALTHPGTISLIIDFLQNGSRLAKENATSLLLVLCQTGGESVENELRRYKSTVVGILCTMLTTGTQRAKGKANDLMKILVVNGPYSFKSGASV